MPLFRPVHLLCSLLACIGLCSPTPPALAERAPLYWGQSMQEVLAGQHIGSYLHEITTGMLSGCSVRVILARDVFLNHGCVMLYAFYRDNLVEYCIIFDTQNAQDNDDLYAEIKNSLNWDYIPYTGPHFATIPDRFTDAAQSTCLLLHNGTQLALYAVDFTFYVNIDGNRPLPDTEDLQQLPVE